MRRQQGQSAVEFALIAPMILFIIFAAIYGGAMFIQFLNYNNEARTIAREIAVAQGTERQTLFEKHQGDAVGVVALYDVSLQTVLWKDSVEYTEYTNDADEVEVRFKFHHDIDFPFGFPPKSFAASYRMQLE